MPTIIVLMVLSVVVKSAVFMDYTNEIILPQGKLVGARSIIGSYNRYLGIPYARVTDRFQEPSAPPKWNGTLRAVSSTVRCKQYSILLNTLVGSEDCLVLNVYTPPDVSKAQKYPVMVFIHGGGFYSGSGSDLIYNPRYLVQKNVIVVTINYRLGAFGFLCLRNKGAPGNAGLKDQISALKWIKKYIKYFGGDPNAVTLFGQSVGAASVNFLILSPATKGLFQRAIMESGSALMPMVLQDDPIERASQVAAKMGHFTKNPDDLLNIFKRASAGDIIKATHNEGADDVYSPYVFGPCVENEDIGSYQVLTDIPSKMIESSKLDPDFKLIIGYNNKEGMYYANRYKTLRGMNNKLETCLPLNMNFTNDMMKDEFIKEIKEFYFNNGSVNYNDLIDFFTDSIINFPSTVLTETLLKNLNISIFNYYFKYSSYRNINKFMTIFATKDGASHADELIYLFDPIIYRLLPSSTNDSKMIDVMSAMWTDFAKTGNPTPRSKNSLVWKTSRNNKLQFMEINKNEKMIGLPNEQRMEFWRRAYIKYMGLYN